MATYKNIDKYLSSYPECVNIYLEKDQAVYIGIGAR
jgi:hypothetical protein